MLTRLIGRRMLAAAFVVALAVIWFLVFRPVMLGGPAAYIIVDGTSMEPTFANLDLVITRHAGSYESGEVIAYYPTTPQVYRASLTIHRIVEANERGEFLTIGDNRSELDQWVARPENVLGKAWLHVPYGGRPILFLRETRNLVTLIAVFVAVTLFRTAGDRQRRGSKQLKHATQPGPPAGIGQFLPAWAVVCLGVLVITASAFAALTIVSYRLDPATERRETRTTHEHLAAWDYSVAMRPSILYPDGVIGPVVPELFDGELQNGAQESASHAPVFRKLARSMDLGFAYALSSDRFADLSGTYRVDLEIVAGDGVWRLSDELVGPTSFHGAGIAFRIPLDFEAVTTRIETIEEESGFAARTYTLVVVPTIEIAGSLGEGAIDERFQSRFPIGIDPLQITPATDLTSSLGRTESLTVVEANYLGIAGMTMPVAEARTIGSLGVAITLLLASVLSGACWLRLRHDEDALIQVRYRPMIVSVSDADPRVEKLERITLASIKDLVRMAQRDGQVIFHQRSEEDRQRYFVQRGTVVYEYVSGGDRQVVAATVGQA